MWGSNHDNETRARITCESVAFNVVEFEAQLVQRQRGAQEGTKAYLENAGKPMGAHVSGSGQRGNFRRDAGSLARSGTGFAFFGSLSIVAKAIKNAADVAFTPVGAKQWKGYRDGLFSLGLVDGCG